MRTKNINSNSLEETLTAIKEQEEKLKRRNAAKKAWATRRNNAHGMTGYKQGAKGAATRLARGHISKVSSETRDIIFAELSVWLRAAKKLSDNNVYCKLELEEMLNNI